MEYSPNGWSVSFNSGAQQVTIGAPGSASIAAGYQVRDYTGMGYVSATFDVVAGTLQLSSVSVSRGIVIGGSASTGTVTLSQAAPAGGITVTLSSSNTGAATVPASVTVAAGQTAATVTVSTFAVSAQTGVTISAIYSGVTKTAALNVYPPDLTSFSISPSATSQGRTVTGTLGLDGPAPSGGCVVSVTSSNGQAALFPAMVTVPAGALTTTFAIATSTVNFPTTVTFTAVFNGGQPSTATLSLTPGNLHVTGPCALYRPPDLGLPGDGQFCPEARRRHPRYPGQ